MSDAADSLFELAADSSEPTASPLPSVRKRRARKTRPVREKAAPPGPIYKRKFPDDGFETERDVLNALRPGAYHLHELYQHAIEAGVATRDNGFERRKSGHVIHEHRLRSTLWNLSKQGKAESLAAHYNNEPVWAIEGTVEMPTRACIIVMGEPRDIELALGTASEIARDLNEPVDLIFCDPPYGLDIGRGVDGLDDFDKWGRDRELLVKGYTEVPVGQEYLEFSREWIGPAAKLLRTGGYLITVTFPQQAADIHFAAREAGLRMQNTLVVPKVVGVQPTSRLAASRHWSVTVMTNGPERLKERTYNILPETPRSASGAPFPTDILPAFYPSFRPKRIRYPNQLPVDLVDYLVRTYSNPGDMVVDFFNGSGTTGLVCLMRNRRYRGIDVNPDALRFTMARSLDIVRREQSMMDFGKGIIDLSHFREPAGRTSTQLML